MIGPYSLTQNGEGTTCKQHDMGLLLLQSPDNKTGPWFYAWLSWENIK